MLFSSALGTLPETVQNHPDPERHSHSEQQQQQQQQQQHKKQAVEVESKYRVYPCTQARIFASTRSRAHVKQNAPSANMKVGGKRAKPAASGTVAHTGDPHFLHEQRVQGPWVEKQGRGSVSTGQVGWRGALKHMRSDSSTRCTHSHACMCKCECMCTLVWCGSPFMKLGHKQASSK